MQAVKVEPQAEISPINHDDIVTFIPRAAWHGGPGAADWSALDKRPATLEIPGTGR
jgi:hypothetical protein